MGEAFRLLGGEAPGFALGHALPVARMFSDSWLQTAVPPDRNRFGLSCVGCSSWQETKPKSE